jgi:Tfp pilus assembly protein PilO
MTELDAAIFVVIVVVVAALVLGWAAILLDQGSGQ